MYISEVSCDPIFVTRESISPGKFKHITVKKNWVDHILTIYNLTSCMALLSKMLTSLYFLSEGKTRYYVESFWTRLQQTWNLTHMYKYNNDKGNQYHDPENHMKVAISSGRVGRWDGTSYPTLMIKLSLINLPSIRVAPFLGVCHSVPVYVICVSNLFADQATWTYETMQKQR